jgi:predicted nucleotidyltransferase
MVGDDARRELEAIYEQMDEVETEGSPTVADLVERQGLHDWQKHQLLIADQVEREYGSRFISVPQMDSYEGYRDMEDFIATVRDPHLQELLEVAITGRGAFRRFKDVLLGYPREREQWFAFKDEAMLERVCEWLEAYDIEPIAASPADVEPLPPQPPARDRLIAEALAFVTAARALSGVLRIALVGSLATDKADPEDVDLLVTVADDADLAPLATLGRKLSGHLQGRNLGGEVFLADPAGNYLGRTCPWKVCQPGIRIRCDALHCGRRPYLHDDLKAVTLPKTLIAAPPVELWPQVITRVAVPADVEQELLEPLRRQA